MRFASAPKLQEQRQGRESKLMLIRANARQLPLRDGCVQTCVTSPPYWGLRDYGTAQWDGGDPACDHKAPAMGGTGRETLVGTTAHGNGTRFQQYRSTCLKCCAIRVDSQIGLEPTPDAYVQTLVQVFREVWRVLRNDGTLWLNLGDSYAHSLRQSGAAHAGAKQNTNDGSIRSGFKPLPQELKEKDLVGIPWRVAFALQADGWYLRSDIIWSKPNPMPESVTDRPTKAHEYLFLLAKQERYYYDAAAIAESFADERMWCPGGGIRHYAPGDRNDATDSRMLKWSGSDRAGRNKRSVWTVATQPYAEAHFATFPPALITPCIMAGSRPGDLVLDPFIGSGTTGTVAEQCMRRWVGCDLTYQHLARTRTAQRGLRFLDTEAYSNG